MRLLVFVVSDLGSKTVLNVVKIVELILKEILGPLRCSNLRWKISTAKGANAVVYSVKAVCYVS
jgi:hypothetical protein